MSRAFRSCCTAAVVGLIGASILTFQRGGLSSVPPASRVLAAEGDLKWYRGNIHTHSLESDGDDYREMIALWYKERGYNFLCFTDHNVLSRGEQWTDVSENKGGLAAYEKLKQRFPDGWVQERVVENAAAEKKVQVRFKNFAEVAEKLEVPGQFLLIQGEEITCNFKTRPIHQNATNLLQPIPPANGETPYEVIQANTDAVIAQRERTGQAMLIHLNHPNFGFGVTAEDLMRVRGENFFEVYNGHPTVYNAGDQYHASAERVWDIILTRRIAELDLPLMYGLATDDGHSYHNIPSRKAEPGRGWVMVLADKLVPGALIEAMERGMYYSSSGVFLNSVSTDRQGMKFEIRPEEGVTYTVEFIGTRKGYDPKSEPMLGNDGKEMAATRRYSTDIGTVFKMSEGTTAEYRFTGDELYVRARIVSSKLHPNPSVVGDVECAWIQPLLGPAAPESKN